jgi:CheY-like chemotaxis protein
MPLPNTPASVLIIEDNDVMRELLARMLQRKGYAVKTVANGRDGLALFDSQPFDVVITDMVMPGMNGLELIQALKRARPDVKVIAVSGHDDRIGYLRVALQIGAKAVCLKPVTPADLVQTVRAVLGANNQN